MKQKLEIVSEALDKAGWVAIGLRADGKFFYGRGGSVRAARRNAFKAARTGRRIKDRS